MGTSDCLAAVVAVTTLLLLKNGYEEVVNIAVMVAFLAWGVSLQNGPRASLGTSKNERRNWEPSGYRYDPGDDSDGGDGC